MGSSSTRQERTAAGSWCLSVQYLHQYPPSMQISPTQHFDLDYEKDVVSLETREGLTHICDIPLGPAAQSVMTGASLSWVKLWT